MNSIILDINNLQRSLGGISVINGISAQVSTGEVIALLGKNGAGKTTLLETLLGFGFPSFGEVKLWGKDATKIDGDIKQRIGFVPQQDELLPHLTGKDHLQLFKGFRTHWNQALVDKLISEWMIPMDFPVGKMSVGQRQKLSILFALAHEPELLVLDEPVASLDPVARRQFLQELVTIAADENRAVIFSTHIISDVERAANKVWMLNSGVLAYQGDLDGLKESVARLSFTSTLDSLDSLEIPNLMRKRKFGTHWSITVTSFTPELKEKLEKQLETHLEMEYLSLEDIFLEMNS